MFHIKQILRQKKESTQVLLITHFRCDRFLAQIFTCRKIMIKLFIVFLFLETFVWHLQKRLETCCNDKNV